MRFKEKLKKYRIDNGLTQEDLAKKLYVSRTLISKWENGVVYPSSDNIEKLSWLMKVEIDHLISTEEAKILSLNANSKLQLSFAEKLCSIISLILFVCGMTLLIVGLVIPQDLTRPDDMFNSVNTITVICFILKLLGGFLSLVGVVLEAFIIIKRKFLT